MIDKNILDSARSIDLITFLERYKGFHFRHFNGEYRPTEHTSLAVKSNRLSWYWHSKGIGGYGAIDFLMKIDGYDFKGAMSLLADEPTSLVSPPTDIPQNKAFILPKKAENNRRAYAYLTITRGLDGHIINKLFQEKKIYEDTKGNAVFVGFDEQGKPKYATLRGTYTNKPFRMDCVGSDKRYCFCMNGTSDCLYTFESAIDSLSHATLENITQGKQGLSEPITGFPWAVQAVSPSPTTYSDTATSQSLYSALIMTIQGEKEPFALQGNMQTKVITQGLSYRP